MSATAPYDEIADWYDEFIADGVGHLFHDFVLPVALDLAGNVAGERVCDLACGQGVVARKLAEQGAKVVGADISGRLLDLARDYERERPLGIEYTHGDAQKLTEIADESFDGVICNMSLMDIPDLQATLDTVARILVSGGWFIFSITHPCFQTPDSRWLEENGATSRVVKDYFVEGFWRSDYPAGVRGKVGTYHRTLGTYVNALSESNMKIERFAEPRANGQVAEHAPGYHEVPAFLVVGCGKL